MADDAFLSYFRRALPDDLAAALGAQLDALAQGGFEAILQDARVRVLLGHDESAATQDIAAAADYAVWSDFVFRRLGALLPSSSAATAQKEDQKETAVLYFLAALAAIYAFLQSNATGPPLPFSPAKTLLPAAVALDADGTRALRERLVGALGADGEAAYKLTPNVELLCFADAVLGSEGVEAALAAAGGGGHAKKLPTALRWARMRVAVLRQRLLGEVAPSVQTAIYGDCEAVAAELLKEEGGEAVDEEARIAFLLERAAAHTLHGFDKKAREDLDRAARERGFEFALTGRMGKRTKFQEKDTSQLVVLARSKGTAAAAVVDGGEELGKGKGNGKGVVKEEQAENGQTAQPKTLDLNDDTLLESISFTVKPNSTTDVLEESSLPPSLASLDAGNQPMLEPLDSIILLSLASSITNTSPQHGLTREETLPYATRVLEGGSSNWQVYTQGLLVRSRIEGYRPRTMERGLLQLQALVDQVIADTTAADGSSPAASGEGSATTFLPRPKEEESAPVSERLKYVFQLCTPSRWELESELASTWVKMGGLRSALEIYERLEMWAEVALCWAATEREDKAKKLIKKQLNHATNGNDEAAAEDETWEGAPRDPAPSDAPRLYCILGDIDKDPAMYEKAWEVSGERYARAMRSLGRFYMAEKDFLKAANAYSKSLRVNSLNQQTWFALGCALLELAEFKRAVEAFTRVVQLDDTDAEAWSNLAAALLHLGPPEEADATAAATEVPKKLPDEEDDDPDAINLVAPRRDPHQHKRDALKALRRAAHLQFDNFRIWDNVLTVAASTVPPSYTDVVTAQRRVIDLRGKTDGEKCVDAAVLDLLVRHVVATEEDGYHPERPGLTRMVVRLIDEAVVPLITGSRLLWQVVARLALWRRRPAAALDAHEKAWRAVTSQPGWESGTEAQWNEVVEATVELVDAYESLGQMEKTEGLAAGSGQVVMKDWRFKARSAVKGVCGKGKEVWEGTEGWERLRECLAGLKG